MSPLTARHLGGMFGVGKLRLGRGNEKHPGTKEHRCPSVVFPFHSLVCMSYLFKGFDGIKEEIIY